MFNAVEFEKLLKRLLRCRAHGRKMVVVLDNVRCHHVKLLGPFHKRREQIELLMAVESCFVKWNKPNKTFIRLCSII